MVDIDRFFEILTELCDELPEEFFHELHQGVLLSEQIKISPYARSDDMFIMGEYRRAYYGNQITIYYGSFARAYPNLDEEALRNRLRETVRHEFRHHMEHLSGMYGADSLEREDQIRLRRYLRGE
jgi:predicted Zn-dependent protease with MMP-like domain